MTDPRDAPPSRLPWPPIIYLAAICLALIAGFLLPVPWLPRPLSDLLFAMGWLMVAAGLAIDVAAIRAMRKVGTTVLPHRASEHLVTRGPFAFSRNPLYLSNTMIVLAIGLIMGNAWFVAFGFAAAFATHKLAIAPEERHLAQRFGKHYRDYQKKVRRWF
ncbi:methyltransferase family protein [Nitratireductor luteus]|uniref:methyltransferase family protein n=1 Tax=Nitratireductor luteus TaxID=2976980 RepID=UPI0022402713|nr:isoprenylcysteine carboxylmethyltransferase family protein [Nitratireductor luteus]